ncbi:hypothetical protein CV102_09360 [Natronococcus pandeyae]|uniref:DUF3267 domain-containing protein n=1 Tax=Natronococcus pandeyae TaxID=2055836 RepID=A0A8J8Q3H7_9EURY|nr:hypothetical protein [Natronococcus pandeyae]TYL38716.1 hypothetical protein CV102_09360 [Natronococcus pandeyae]
MLGTELLITGGALAVIVVLGLIAHEWSHALVLRLAAIDYTISYAPDRRDGVLGLVRSCPWAVVQPHPTGAEPPWILRIAALAPLVLAVPAILFVTIGSATTQSPVVTAALIGWLACAIPSPQDFSVAFHAHTALQAPSETDGTRRVPHAD